MLLFLPYTFLGKYSCLSLTPLNKCILIFLWDNHWMLTTPHLSVCSVLSKEILKGILICWQDYGLDVESFRELVQGCPERVLELSASCCQVWRDSRVVFNMAWLWELTPVTREISPSAFIMWLLHHLVNYFEDVYVTDSVKDQSLSCFCLSLRWMHSEDLPSLSSWMSWGTSLRP